MRKWHQLKKFLIIDLDAHQGNGHERDAINDRDIYILDAYNHRIYPGDQYAKSAIACDMSVHHGDDDDSYIDKLNYNLPEIFESF